MSRTASGDSSAPGPLLRLVRGRPTDEEVAALVAVVAARARGPSSAAPAPARAGSRWAAQERAVRQPLRRRPGGWRAATLPR
ncbi:MAG: acyl-CoA carboxylase epsilon subunit [Nocardioidaceae bacterium]